MSVENNSENVFQKKYEEEHDKYVRLAADFENYRKNKEKELVQMQVMATQSLVLELIRNIDDVVVAYMNSKDPDGFKIVYHNLMVTLNKYGVEQYGEEDDVFDPDIHDAVSISMEGLHERGTISNVLKYGYKLGGKVIRPAEVIVEK